MKKYSCRTDTRAFNLRNEEKGWTKEKRQRMSLDFDPTSIFIHSRHFIHALFIKTETTVTENRRQKECGDREGCLEKFSGLSLPPSLGITLYYLGQETWEMKGEVLVVSLVFCIKRNACRASPALGMRVSIRAWFKCVFILDSSFFILEILVKLLSVFSPLEPLLEPVANLLK